MSKTPTQRPSLRPVTSADRAPSDFELSLRSARPMVEITIPRTTLAARLRLLTRTESQQVDLATREYMKAGGVELSVSTGEEYLAEKATRVMAIAVRTDEAPHEPLAPLEQWRNELDDDQLGALWRRYEDLRQQYDPDPEELTDAEFEQIVEAGKKKDSDLLSSFGSRKLARCITTLVGQLPTSPTAKSSPGGSPPAPPGRSG